MEFRFNLNEMFKQPIVEIGHTLIPQGFKGDRRALWDTLSKVTDVVNAMGSASAAAQGLTKPITSAERLRNCDQQTVYLLLDHSAHNGKGAVTGMLKTGRKGLYVFDRDGHHYQVQAPCILDFYVHESRQRSGFGKMIFEHMLQKEEVAPKKLAIDRPSDKFLGFLRKHYQLEDPIRQMNNYVVYDGFFPDVKENGSGDQKTPIITNNSETPTKRGSNGLQSQIVTSPYGRYGAPRPPCSMGQIIHNQSAAVTAQEPSGLKLQEHLTPGKPRSPMTLPRSEQPRSQEAATAESPISGDVARAIAGNGLGAEQKRERAEGVGSKYHWPFHVPSEGYAPAPRKKATDKWNVRIDEIIHQEGRDEKVEGPKKVPLDEEGRPLVPQQKGGCGCVNALHNAVAGSSAGSFKDRLHSITNPCKANALVDDSVPGKLKFNHFSKPLVQNVDGSFVNVAHFGGDDGQMGHVQLGQLQQGQLQQGQLQPEQMQQRQVQPGQLQQGHVQQGQLQPGHVQAGQLQQGQLQQGQLQVGQLQQGQLQPGHVQAGQLQQGQMQQEHLQQGQLQQEQLQQRQLQQEQLQQRQLQQGQLQQEQLQQGQLQPAQMQQGHVQPEQVQSEQQQLGQVQPRQVTAGQLQPGQLQPVQTHLEQLQPGKVQAEQMQPEQMQLGQMQPVQMQASPKGVAYHATIFESADAQQNMEEYCRQYYPEYYQMMPQMMHDPQQAQMMHQQHLQAQHQVMQHPQQAQMMYPQHLHARNLMMQQHQQQAQMMQHPQMTQHPQMMQHLQMAQHPQLMQHPQMPQHPQMMQHLQMAQHPQLMQHPQMPQHPQMMQHPQMTQDPQMTQHPQMAQHPQMTQHPQQAPMTQHPQHTQAQHQAMQQTQHDQAQQQPLQPQQAQQEKKQPQPQPQPLLDPIKSSYEETKKALENMAAQNAQRPKTSAPPLKVMNGLQDPHSARFVAEPDAAQDVTNEAASEVEDVTKVEGVKEEAQKNAAHQNSSAGMQQVMQPNLQAQANQGYGVMYQPQMYRQPQMQGFMNNPMMTQYWMQPQNYYNNNIGASQNVNNVETTIKEESLNQVDDRTDKVAAAEEPPQMNESTQKQLHTHTIHAPMAQQQMEQATEVAQGDCVTSNNAAGDVATMQEVKQPQLTPYERRNLVDNISNLLNQEIADAELESAKYHAMNQRNLKNNRPMSQQTTYNVNNQQQMQYLQPTRIQTQPIGHQHGFECAYRQPQHLQEAQHHYKSIPCAQHQSQHRLNEAYQQQRYAEATTPQPSKQPANIAIDPLIPAELAHKKHSLQKLPTSKTMSIIRQLFNTNSQTGRRPSNRMSEQHQQQRQQQQQQQERKPQQSVNALQRNMALAMGKSRRYCTPRTDTSMSRQLTTRASSKSAFGTRAASGGQQPQDELVEHQPEPGEPQPTPPPSPPPARPDRPQSLQLQSDDDNKDADDEVDAVVVLMEKNGVNEADDAVSARKTPSHLTEQGYFDLKFYHNKLW